MEQSTLPGQFEHVWDVFPVISQRLREILFFFRSNLLPLLAVTLPFAAAGTLAVQLLGEPVVLEGDQQGEVQWSSVGFLLALYPLALGVKILAIHRLAGHEPLHAGALLAAALQRWPTLAATSLLSGLFIGSVAMLCVGVGIEVLRMLGLLEGVGGGLLMFFLLPALYVYARLGMASIIATIEGLPATLALGTAWRRTQPVHGEVFRTMLAVLGGVLLLMLALFGLIAAGGDEFIASAPGDLLARGLGEWLFCVVSIAFYRFWSLQPRDAAP